MDSALPRLYAPAFGKLNYSGVFVHSRDQAAQACRQRRCAFKQRWQAGSGTMIKLAEILVARFLIPTRRGVPLVVTCRGAKSSQATKILSTRKAVGSELPRSTRWLSIHRCSESSAGDAPPLRCASTNKLFVEFRNVAVLTPLQPRVFDQHTLFFGSDRAMPHRSAMYGRLDAQGCCCGVRVPSTRSWQVASSIFEG